MNAGPHAPSIAASRAGRLALGIACAAFSLFHLWTAVRGPFDPLVQRGVFIGGAVMLAFWVQALSARTVALRIGCVFFALVGLYGGVHAIANHARFMDVMNDMLPLDMWVALVFFIAILVATQRLLGWALPVLAVIAVAYYVFGHSLISGLWQPPPTSLDTIVSTLYASTSGVFGFMADIGTSVIAVYVIFGALLMATGAGEVFVQVAQIVAGRGHGGPAKVAVVTSALFGTVSGSAVANVMAVGSLTIPTMERAGYPKALAAGIEASASAGGQIMPPIMGAGAFLMAELLNIPYLTIAKSATLPAILYFLVIFVSVDLYARRHRLGRDGASVRVRLEIDKAIPLVVSVVTLIGMLVANYTPTYAGAMATGALLVASAALRIGTALFGHTRDGLTLRTRTFLYSVGHGLADGGKGLIMIAVLLGCAGILAAVLSASGLGSKVSSELIGIAGNNLLAALVLAAVLCILLGMDVPTTASYVLTAAVAAPVLTKLGLPPLTAHLFIFYFAILSAITPPVCASVYAAAAIAGERFWSVARYAMLMAGAVYVIPFMLVYRGGLLLQGSLTTIAYDAMITGVAIVAMCGAMIGYLAGIVPWFARIGLFAASVLFFVPGMQYDISGAILLGAILLMQVIRARRTVVVAAAPGVRNHG
ncbi:MAG: TRAP transporter fused permease subunit [Burkholderiales bacterium]|nr:TRAP transporter fused permease subunit [Burkholderiales bacterium]